MKTYSMKTSFIFSGAVLIQAKNKQEAENQIKKLFSAEMKVLKDTTDQEAQKIIDYCFNMKPIECKTEQLNVI